MEFDLDSEDLMKLNAEYSITYPPNTFQIPCDQEPCEYSQPITSWHHTHEPISFQHNYEEPTRMLHYHQHKGEHVSHDIHLFDGRNHKQHIRKPLFPPHIPRTVTLRILLLSEQLLFPQYGF